MARLKQNPHGFEAKNGASKGAQKIAWAPLWKTKHTNEVNGSSVEKKVKELKPNLKRNKDTIKNILDSI